MPKNDPSRAVTQFCLAMEEHRRTEAGRVRTAKEFVSTFFPWDEQNATDRLFLHMPQEVRGPIISGWRIRGAKAALKDDDERVRSVVHDALVAGDIDETVFEEGVTPNILIDWITLADWWTFWRKGKLTGVAIQKALATARELALIDDRWFLLNVQGRGGKLKGTDVLCDTLTKDQIVAWVRKIHESGDGSPSGIIAALGWETVLAKTAQDALLFALDEFAKKVGLVPAEPEAPRVEETAATPTEAPDVEVTTGDRVSVEVMIDEPNTTTNGHAMIDSGLSVAIPDVPIEERGSDFPEADTNRPTATGLEVEPPASIPSVEERSLYAESESPKLAEARAAMMAMLSQGASTPPEQAFEGSTPPAKPSSLEWPEPAAAKPTPAETASVKPQPTSKEPAKAPPPVPRKPPVPPRAR